MLTTHIPQRFKIIIVNRIMGGVRDMCGIVAQCIITPLLLNNSVGIIKKLNKQLLHHWFNDHCWQYMNKFQSLPQSRLYQKW